jgi:hypothetical protein
VLVAPGCNSRNLLLTLKDNGCQTGTMLENDVLGNQKQIIENQQTILANHQVILANQKVIQDNQGIIQRNQDSLQLILKNQEKILALLQK